MEPIIIDISVHVQDEEGSCCPPSQASAISAAKHNLSGIQVAQLKSGKGDTTETVAATAAGVQDLQKEAAATSPSQASAISAAKHTLSCLQVAQLKSGKGDTTDSVAATAAGVQDLQKEAAATPSQAAADPAAAKQQSSTTKGKNSYYKKNL